MFGASLVFALSKSLICMILAENWSWKTCIHMSHVSCMFAGLSLIWMVIPTVWHWNPPFAWYSGVSLLHVMCYLRLEFVRFLLCLVEQTIFCIYCGTWKLKPLMCTTVAMLCSPIFHLFWSGCKSDSRVPVLIARRRQRLKENETSTPAIVTSFLLLALPRRKQDIKA
jgi:hypothetical protein